MYELEFKSIYANDIYNFISLKNSLGIYYKKGTLILRNFDGLALSSGQKGPGITEEFFKYFINIDPNINNKTRYDKYSIMRQFCKYLIDLKYDCFLPVMPRYEKNSHVPYIFTADEMHKIFLAIDSLRVAVACVTGLLCFPALIRFIFATGVRIGEAINLQNTDVNLIERYIKITDGKNKKERLLPISEALTEVLLEYLRNKAFLKENTASTYFFVKTNGLKLTANTVRSHFRDSLKIAGIGNHSEFSSPRIHDLRHTFAVNTLIKIIESDRDPYITLPYLSKYLGHSSVSSTDTYVKLSNRIYPDLTKNLDLNLIDVYPKLTKS